MNKTGQQNSETKLNVTWNKHFNGVFSKQVKVSKYCALNEKFMYEDLALLISMGCYQGSGARPSAGLSLLKV